MAFRLNASMVNFAADQMDKISGLPPTGARIALPPTPRGSMIFNNIKVDNSTVGAINTGNVRTIDVSLTLLHESGHDHARDALKALTEAILADQSLSESQKAQMVEQVAFLSEQTVVAAPQRKLGLITATLDALTKGAGAVTTIGAAHGRWLSRS